MNTTSPPPPAPPANPAGETPTPPSKQHPRWYYSIWFVLGMLFFVLGPLGLPLLWKSPRFPLWSKIALTAVMVAYVVALVYYTRLAVTSALESLEQLELLFP